VAWIGIIASMFLPIIVCQFLYMPFIAVPAWNTATWTTAIEADTTALYPSVVIATDGYDPAEGVPVTLFQPECSVRNTTEQPVNCTISDVQTGHPPLWFSYQFVTFNSKAQPHAIGTTDIASAVAVLYLAISFNCKSKVR
jgi:hypothetical protein